MNFNDINITNDEVHNLLATQNVFSYLKQKFNMIKSNTWNTYMDGDKICILYDSTYSYGKILITFLVDTCVHDIYVEHFEVDNGFDIDNLFHSTQVRFTPSMYKKILMWFNHIHHDLGLEIVYNHNAVLFDFKDSHSLFTLKSIDKNTTCIIDGIHDYPNYFYNMGSRDFRWLIKSIGKNELPPIYFVMNGGTKKGEPFNSFTSNERANHLIPYDESLRLERTVYGDFKMISVNNVYTRLGYKNMLHLPMQYNLFKVIAKPQSATHCMY